MGWLTSCDNDALAAGENLAVLGGELLQFGQALPLGGGKIRLSHLLRGRGGTEWACADHGVGDPFCLLQPGALQAVSLPSWSLGAAVNATVSGGTGASINFAGEALRPPFPVNLAAELQSDGSLVLSWTRRSRQGFAWLDGIDAPLGEAIEQYSVGVSGSAAAIELQSDQTGLVVPASAVAGLGAGPVTVEVRQIGDFAASHPAQISLIIS
jgi:hypothetical protein